MAKMNYPALTALLLIPHPKTGAYNADAQTAADELVALNIPFIKATVSGTELLNVTDATQFKALSVDMQNRWLNLCAISEMDPADGTIAHAITLDTFTSGKTLTALNALRTEMTSAFKEAATDLGYQGRLTFSHIKAARREV